MTMTYQSLYPAHIAELQQRTRRLLERENLDALVVHYVETPRTFLVEMYYPFKAHPLFKAWITV